MNKYFLIIAVIFLFPVCFAKHEYPEKAYQQYWCDKQKGITEYKLDDKTRVDCLTDDLAVEFDFAPKWHECIGQALYYGKKTDKISACVLILENEEKDLKYLYRLKYAVYQKNKLPDFHIYTITKDVLNSSDNCLSSSE